MFLMLLLDEVSMNFVSAESHSARCAGRLLPTRFGIHIISFPFLPIRVALFSSDLPQNAVIGADFDPHRNAGGR